MPLLSLTLSGANGKPHDWTHVSTPLQEVQTLLNTTGLDSSNVQDNGLTPSKIRTNANIDAVRIKIRNATGGSLSAGTLVYYSGTYSDGTTNYPTVAKAISHATDSSNFFAQGILVATTANGADGTVAVFYELTGVDTSSTAVGDLIYLDTTAGGWTKTRPTGGQYIQVVGTVTVVHASTGRIAFSFGSVPEFLTGGTSGLGASLQTLTVQSASGAASDIYHISDAGEDNADKWKISVADGGVRTWENYVSGSYVAKMTLSSAGAFQTTGTVTAAGFTIGSAAINEAELETIDSVSAGTVAASKAVVVDSNKDIGSFRNVTLTGELDAATLDISGDVDIDGTANLDAVDIDGAVQIDGTVSVGVNDQGYDVKLFGDTASAYLLWDTSADKLLTAGGATIDIVKDKLLIGGTAVTTTAAELNVLDAVSAGTVTASLAVVVDSDKDIGSFRNITLTGELDAGSLDVSGDADIDGTLEADAITLGGTALGSLYSPIAGSSSIVTTGALNSGSITSGFGTINNGSSTITTTGALAAGATTLSGDTVVGNGYNLIVGHSSQLAFANSAEVQVLGTGSGDTRIALGAFIASTVGPGIEFLKSRNGTIGSNTIVQDGDDLGDIVAYVDDGTDFGSRAGYIRFQVDGTPGANDTPGRIIFGTTADGAAGETERMRITNAGNVGIGQTPDARLAIKGVDTGSSYALRIDDSGGNEKVSLRNDGYLNLTRSDTDASLLQVWNNGSGQIMNVTCQGRLGVGTQSPASPITVSLAGNAYIYSHSTGSSAGFKLQTDDSNFTWYSANGSNALRLYDNNAGAERLQVNSSGNVGIGSDDVWGNLHIRKDSSAAVNLEQHTGDAAGPVYRLDKARGSIASPAAVQSGDSLGKLEWTGWSSSGQRLTTAHIETFANQNWSTNNGGSHMKFSTQANNATTQTLAMTINHDATIVAQNSVFINSTSNGSSTIGLTINQATNDDEIISLKSTGDIDTGLAGIGTGDDTFCNLKKANGDKGGVRIMGLAEDDQDQTLILHSIGGEDTTDTSSSDTGQYHYCGKNNGSTQVSFGSTGNMWGVSNNGVLRTILKGNGDLHITNTTLTALDDEDDIGLVRAFQKASSKGVGLVMSKWDEVMKENEEDLRRVGVLSSQSDFVIQQNFNSLIGGSVWQLYTKLQETKELYEDKIAALEQRLLRLEA